MKKPDKCCGMGSYECQIPMPIRGRRQEIDLCIADIVAALNAANIATEASCCGHGKHNGNIVLEDGRWIDIIFNPKMGARCCSHADECKDKPQSWKFEACEIHMCDDDKSWFCHMARKRVECLRVYTDKETP